MSIAHLNVISNPLKPEIISSEILVGQHLTKLISAEHRVFINQQEYFEDNYIVKNNDSITIVIYPGLQIPVWIYYVMAAAALIIGIYALSQIQDLEEIEGISEQYNIRGQRNEPRMGEPIPVRYGQDRVYPDVLSRPYSTYINNDQYLHQLFCLGKGKYNTSNLKIEDTSISSFTNVQFEIVYEGPVTLFPTNVITSVEVTGQEVSTTYIGPFIINPSGTKANRLAVDLTWPQGMYHTKDSGSVRTVILKGDIKIDYREVNDSGTPIGPWTNAWTDSFGAATQAPLHKTYEFNVTNGRYEVRVKRTQVAHDTSRTRDKFIWESARAFIIDENEIWPDTTVIAVRMKASEQLSDISSQRINIEYQRKIDVYNGSTWDDDQITNNPAWAIADVITNAYGANQARTVIDADNFKVFADYCDTSNYEFNGTFDTKGNVWKGIEHIASIGKAFIQPTFNLISIVIEQAQSLPAWTFNHADMNNEVFQVKFDRTQDQDSVEARYFDAALEHQETTIVVPIKINKMVQANAVSVLNEANATLGFTANSSPPTFESQSTITNNSNYAIHCVASDSADGFYKDLQTDYGFVNGDTIVIEIDVRHVGSGGVWSFRLTSDSLLASNVTEIGVDLTNTDTTFETRTLEYTHSANTRYFGAREDNAGNNGGVYFDNCIIYKKTTANSKKLDLRRGVTSRSHAYDLVTMVAAKLRYHNLPISFDTELEGYLPVKGDLISVATDTLGLLAIAGEILAYNAGSKTLTLSQPMFTELSVDYGIMLRKSNGDVDGPHIATIDPADEYKVILSGVALGFDPTPVTDENKIVFAWGEIDFSFRKFVITKVTPKDDLVMGIEAINYEDIVHDNSGVIPAIVTRPSLPNIEETPTVSNIVISSDADSTVAYISWLAEGNWESFLVQTGNDGINWGNSDRVFVPRYTLPVPAEGILYIRIAAIGIFVGAWVQKSQILGNAITESTSITGLAPSGTFSGSSITFTWNRNTFINSYLWVLSESGVTKQTGNISGKNLLTDINELTPDEIGFFGSTLAGWIETSLSISGPNAKEADATVSYQGDNLTLETLDAIEAPPNNSNITHVNWSDVGNPGRSTVLEDGQYVVECESNTGATADARTSIDCSDLFNLTDGEWYFIIGEVKHVGSGGDWEVILGDLETLSGSNIDTLISLTNTTTTYQTFTGAFKYSSSPSSDERKYFGIRETNGSNDGGMRFKDVRIFRADAFSFEAVTATAGGRFSKNISLIDLIIGETYQIKGRWKHSGSGGDWSARMDSTNSASGGTVLDTLDNTETNFQDLDQTFIYDGSEIWLIFGENSGSNDGGIFLDNLEIIRARSVTFTNEDIKALGMSRSFDFTVYPSAISGRIDNTTGASVSVNNPQVATLTGHSSITTISGFIVSASVSGESDVDKYRVYGSYSTGFSISDANFLAEGPLPIFHLGVDSDQTTLFYKIFAYDQWGTDSINSGPEISISISGSVGAYSSLSGLPGNLSAINPTEGGKLTGIANGAQVNTINAGSGLNALDSGANTKLNGISELATVGAIWGTDIGNLPGNLAAINSGEGSKLSGIANGAQINTIDSGDGLSALDSGADTKLGGIAVGSTVGVNQKIGIRLNSTSFTSANPGEFWLHGFNAEGNASDINPTILLPGAAGSGEEHVMLGTSAECRAGFTGLLNKIGYIIYDKADTTPFTVFGGSRNICFAFQDNDGTWKYDNNGGETTLPTITPDFFAIGTLATSSVAEPNNTFKGGSVWGFGISLEAIVNIRATFGGQFGPSGNIFNESGSNVQNTDVYNTSIILVEGDGANVAWTFDGTDQAPITTQQDLKVIFKDGIGTEKATHTIRFTYDGDIEQHEVTGATQAETGDATVETTDSIGDDFVVMKITHTAAGITTVARIGADIKPLTFAGSGASGGK